MVLLTDRNLTTLRIKPWEQAFKQFKSPVLNVVSSIPREMCVRTLNGTVARWLLCVKHNGEQVETVQ